MKNKIKISKTKSENSKDKKFLETMIKFSKQAITNSDTSVDELFRNQTERLEKQLKNLK